MSGLKDQLAEALVAAGVYGNQEMRLAQEGAKWLIAEGGFDKNPEIEAFTQSLMEDLEGLRGFWKAAVEERIVKLSVANAYASPEALASRLEEFGNLPPGAEAYLARENPTKAYLVVEAPGGATALVVWENHTPRPSVERDWEALARALEGSLSGAPEHLERLKNIIEERFPHLVADEVRRSELLLEALKREAHRAERALGGDPLADFNLKANMPIDVRDTLAVATNWDTYALRALREGLEGGAEPPPIGYVTSSILRTEAVRGELERMARNAEISDGERALALEELRYLQFRHPEAHLSSTALAEASKRIWEAEKGRILETALSYLEYAGYQPRAVLEATREGEREEKSISSAEPAL